MAHPDIAKQIGLSDEQRAQVSAILAERAAALQNTAGDSKAETQAKIQYEQKLAEVLTPQQLVEWPNKVAQRSLRFNFRFQLWTDVLSAGAQLLENLTRAVTGSATGSSDSNVTSTPSFIARDEKTGQSYLKLPLPEPEVVQKIVDLIGVLKKAK